MNCTGDQYPGDSHIYFKITSKIEKKKNITKPGFKQMQNQLQHVLLMKKTSKL